VAPVAGPGRADSKNVFVLLALLAWVGTIFAAGLHSGQEQRRNEVTWLEEHPGLRFDGHGIAISEALDANALPTSRRTRAFSLVLDLRFLDTPAARGFEHVVTLFGRAEHTQLVVGRWRNSLITTNGNDYDYARRLPRLTADLDDGTGPWHLVVLSSGELGSALYVDGIRTAVMAERLALPEGPTGLHLIVGNSAYGNMPWHGMIRGFAVVPGAMSAEAAAGLTASGSPRPAIDELGLPDPWLLFAFREGEGTTTWSSGSQPASLGFAAERSLLRPDFFRPGLARASGEDVVLNLLGFMPLGFLSALFLLQKGSPLLAVAAALLLGFVLSATVETAQAWLPMRHSSVLDLALNTLGSTLGAALVPAARHLLSNLKGR